MLQSNNKTHIEDQFYESFICKTQVTKIYTLTVYLSKIEFSYFQ